MADAEISAQIENWSIGGGLFLDYCNLLHSFAAYNEVSSYSLAGWHASSFVFQQFSTQLLEQALSMSELATYPSKDLGNSLFYD